MFASGESPLSGLPVLRNHVVEMSADMLAGRPLNIGVAMPVPGKANVITVWAGGESWGQQPLTVSVADNPLSVSGYSWWRSSSAKWKGERLHLCDLIVRAGGQNHAYSISIEQVLHRGSLPQ